LGQIILTIVMKEEEIPTSELKAHLAAILERVAHKRATFLISKHGKPLARLVPVDVEPPVLYGALRGLVEVVGDIVEPIDVDWEALP
jgi:prevent-host-death family protein